MKSILKAILPGILIVGLQSCANSEDSAPIEIQPQQEVASGIISVSGSQFSSAGMELGKIERREFSRLIKVNGMMDVPPQNKASVSAYFGGYVKDLELLPGQRIEKGQLLFTLENPEYVQVQQDFLEAKGKLSYLQSDYERQQDLVKDNVTSQKNFLKAESEYQVTRARFQSLKKKLEMMNIDPERLIDENLRTSIAVRAPISGQVTAVNVNRGKFINPSDVAVSITNTDHLHLELNIFEKDLPWVRKGQQIHFRLQNNPGQSYLAEVYLVNQYLDAETRTAQVHAHLLQEAEVHNFAPGTYVEAEIISATDTAAALPEDAVQEQGGQSWVLVQSSSADAHEFVKQEVKIGRRSGGYLEVLNPEDFTPGGEVLVKGGFELVK
ncbi:MAG TPA: efflux RND transporter periplasmic adaptor subunit [Cryomorphaceae bacterium]|nr:efflux transporter periplasmic adaptor subunit [Owenweeksia sp.]MBF98450.1 efflux transporter periplasmic adaptor subunit [Owenweeksia sp.]HAD97202.1 efflux RND transporter periplasmic adaptor subunit [Cryomorphaceae bacterium]HBF18884.1 efflux RND transporter periplasmic adaptor subunit [Cryomorphaceae bacterium]|tara:strand:- start:234 stop:1379 length:1146 start_codon:yes stop_codon:yes gene_type:complete